MSKLRVGVAGPVGSGKDSSGRSALPAAAAAAAAGQWSPTTSTPRRMAQFLTPLVHWSPSGSGGWKPAAAPTPPSGKTARSTGRRSKSSNSNFQIWIWCWLKAAATNLAASFSPELVDLCIYVIDVAAGDKIPRKGGPGITRSDLLVINKIDLASMVGANLRWMQTRHRAHAWRSTLVLHQLAQWRGA